MTPGSWKFTIAIVPSSTIWAKCHSPAGMSNQSRPTRIATCDAIRHLPSESSMYNSMRYDISNQGSNSIHVRVESSRLSWCRDQLSVGPREDWKKEGIMDTTATRLWPSKSWGLGDRRMAVGWETWVKVTSIKAHGANVPLNPHQTPNSFSLHPKGFISTSFIMQFSLFTTMVLMAASGFVKLPIPYPWLL